MRKLLLASAAVLGASVGTMGFASAQTTNLPPAALTPNPMSGQVPTLPASIPGANSNNNYQAPMLPPGLANPTPGSIVVRVNARVVFYTTASSSSLDKIGGTGAANTGAAKVGPLATIGYMRLYFAMDGLTTNGLRYGGSIEIRTLGSGVGGNTNNTGSSGSTNGETLYVRRAFGYIANPNAGILRFGQADGPFGIFDNGVTTFQGFDDGGWNGDLPGAGYPGNAGPTFPFLSQQGAEYGSSKLVYLSPQLAGFDFGISWAPNNSGLQDSNCGTASSGCYNLTSSSATGNTDGTRYVNAYEAALRMQETFGPAGILAYGGYMGSGSVSYQGPAEVGGVKVPTYKGLGLGMGGAAITVGPITVGGNIQGGTYNGAGALQPSGGVHAVAWLGGIQYSSGPFTVGTSYYQFDSQGSPSLVGITQRHEDGYAAGMTYGVAPGLVLWVSYIYGTRHQGDWNFSSGTVGTAYNNVKAQSFGVGTMIRW
jgi:hypothetical protein